MNNLCNIFLNNFSKCLWIFALTFGFSMLCVLTSEQVFLTLFAGEDNIFQCFFMY